MESKGEKSSKKLKLDEKNNKFTIAENSEANIVKEKNILTQKEKFDIENTSDDSGDKALKQLENYVDIPPSLNLVTTKAYIHN